MARWKLLTGVKSIARTYFRLPITVSNIRSIYSINPSGVVQPEWNSRALAGHEGDSV